MQHFLSFPFEHSNVLCLYNFFIIFKKKINWNRAIIVILIALPYFLNLFFIEELLYRMLFSVKPQHKSAIGTHISPPF